MTWDLFGREKRDAIARNEARATMDALDKTVNGDEPVKPKPPSFNIQCGRCPSPRQELTYDPVKPGRCICPRCGMVLIVSLERNGT